jgi:hypothetical protein
MATAGETDLRLHSIGERIVDGAFEALAGVDAADIMMPYDGQ